MNQNYFQNDSKIVQFKAPFGGSTAAPLFFLAVLVLARPWRCLVEVPSCFWRVPCVLLPKCLSISRAVGMFWKYAEVGIFAKSPSVRRAKSRSIYACAHGLFSAKRFGNPRSWSRACLLYVVMSSFLASLLGRTFGGFGVALGAIWLHFGAWRRPKGTKNQSSFMTAFWNCKKYDALTF